MSYNETPTTKENQPMKAVLFTEETYPLIIRKMGLTKTEKEKRSKKKLPASYRSKKHYFIADYFPDVNPSAAWVIVEEGFLEKNFDYNQTGIETRFVEIIRK